MLRPTRPLAPQRGIATVLILLLVGLSLSAAVFGTAHYIRSQQQQDVAAHAQTQAQMKAWTGAELVRQYLQQLQDSGQLAALYAKAPPFDLTLSGDGVTNAVLARITASDSTAKTVTARITGVTAPDSSAEARAVVEVVYAVGAGSGTAPGQCGTPIRSSTVLRGDVSITGGTTSFTSGENYTDVAIDGSLTIQSASEAIISGCTKGDITLSGGGIDANATLSSQNGTIRINSMAQPTNATLWARAISIGNTGSANYNALKAGAYQANVKTTGDVIVGTAYAGGRLLSATAGPSVPWRTGTVEPLSTGRLLVTLGDGGEYLVDMAKVAIDSATGAVSNARAAAQKVNASGSAELPDSFTLHATDVAGGGIDLYTLSVQAETWGYHIAMKGWGGTYNKVWPAGHFETINPTITDLLGGGDLWAKEAGGYPGNCYSCPAFGTGGPIAGRFYYGSGKTLLSPPPNGLSSVAGTSPGLPGAPFCDTRTDTFDAAAFRSQANYIFDFDSDGKPRLTIQNVKLRPGGGASEVSIDKANIDLKTVDPVSGTKPEDMKLRLIQGKKFLGCSNQAPENQYSDALACLRSATPQSGWNLSGITKFPPGIALFIGPVTIDGVAGSQGALYNTILATGDVTLTGSGHGPLIAPNFASPVDKMCGGDFYPSNLCESASELKTYKYQGPDGTAKTITGMPLANIAIGTNASLAGNSWDGNNGIQGHVIVGKGFTTSGATISIKGTITVGVNEPGNTTLQQGGFQIDTTNMSLDQQYMPVPGGGSAAAPGGVRLKWSRYL